MNTDATWADLLSGDILMSTVDDDVDPVCLVISCDPDSNLFTWMSLTGDRIGKVLTPNLRLSGLWNDSLAGYYNVLRGSEMIYLKKTKRRR